MGRSKRRSVQIIGIPLVNLVIFFGVGLTIGSLANTLNGVDLVGVSLGLIAIVGGLLRLINKNSDENSGQSSTKPHPVSDSAIDDKTEQS